MEIIIKDLMTTSFRNTMIDWCLLNVMYINAVICYATYAIQKDSIVITGSLIFINEESLNIYNIIVMILKIRG